jgi:hypothetical protein
MSGDGAPTKDHAMEPSIPTALAVPPISYRVSVVPGSIEVNARLKTPEEIRDLMKVLRAGLLILGKTDEEVDASVTHRVAAIRAASRQQ